VNDPRKRSHELAAEVFDAAWRTIKWFAWLFAHFI
jgi:hypothetical protein